jgi:hypothetical protein
MQWINENILKKSGVEITDYKASPQKILVNYSKEMPPKENSKEKTKKEDRRLVLQTDHLDHTMMVYPLHVLSTNRVCETMVSRERVMNGGRNIGFHQDVSNINKKGGLMLGLRPYLLTYLTFSW